MEAEDHVSLAIEHSKEDFDEGCFTIENEAFEDSGCYRKRNLIHKERDKDRRKGSSQR